MNIGLDVGYSAVKAIGGDGDRRATFPSVVGTPEKARFSVTGSNDSILLTSPDKVQVGQGAVEQSRFLDRREDREWIESREWYLLALAAFTELTTATGAELRIVTGLPVAFYEGDRAAVRDRLLGEHRAQQEGRHGQTFRVTECKVIPQPFGTLLCATLDDRGRIVDRDLATGTVGIIDVGGKTTNLLSVNKLAEISHETESADVGAWDAVRAVRSWLTTHCPGLDLRDHEISQAITERQVKYYGDPVDLSAPIEEALEPLGRQVVAVATQLWNGGAALDAILVSGGGALLLGKYITRHFRHARTISAPVFSNALGYWRFAQRLASR